MKRKYIMIDGFMPIVFDVALTHADVGEFFNKEDTITSAGFVDNEGNCFGQSDSLGIESNPDKDTRIIKRLLIRNS